MVNNDDPASSAFDSGSLADDNIKFARLFSGERCCLRLHGDMKHGNSALVFDEAESIYQSGARHLILDLRKLNYCDTSGLQCLVRIYKFIQCNSDLRFTVLVGQGDLMEIFKTCRFDKFIEITTDASILDGDWAES